MQRSDLQEVLGASTGGSRDGALFVRNGGEDGELGVAVLVQVHDGSDVAAAVAVVRRRPDGNDVLGFEVILEPFVDELMGPSNETQTVDVVELFQGISSHSVRRVRFGQPLKRPYHQTATLLLSVRPPMCPHPPDHSTRDHRKHLHEESPELELRRGPGQGCGFLDSNHRVRREPCRQQPPLVGGSRILDNRLSRLMRCRTLSDIPRRSRRLG